MQVEDGILCCYRNATDQVVVVRARGLATFFFERVVFPFEVITFHSPRQCEVEIIRRTPAGLQESEWVSAEELMVGEPFASARETGEKVLSHRLTW